MRTSGKLRIHWRATSPVTRIHNPANLAMRDGQLQSKPAYSRAYDRTKCSPAMRRALEAISKEFE